LLIQATVINAQATKAASKPAGKTNTKQADAQNKNNTAQAPKKNTATPKKSTASAPKPGKKKSTASAPKPGKKIHLTDEMCSQSELIPVFSSAEEPRLYNKAEVNGGICNGGMYTQTCCNKKDFQRIESEWNMEINGENNALNSYIQAIKDLTLNHIYVLGEYLAPFYPRLLKEREENKISGQLFIHIQNIVQTQFNQGIFYKKWKQYSNQCLNYLSQSVKGSLCAACDPIESRRFQKVPMEHKGKTIQGQYVYPDDLQLFSLKCGNYLYGLRTIHRLIRSIALTWNHFNED